MNRRRFVQMLGFAGLAIGCAHRPAITPTVVVPELPKAEANVELKFTGGTLVSCVVKDSGVGYGDDPADRN